MIMKISLFVRWLVCAAVSSAATAFAISPVQVQKLLDSGEKITFIDVRLNVLFQKGHIPGAINIPAHLVPEKQLPPLGNVVVYDGGNGEDAASAAVAALNQKSGITAEVLDGGYAAWEMTQAATTKRRGVGPEETPLITYAQLKNIRSSDVVLVDLRHGKSVARVAGKGTATPPLTDLQAEFPAARIVHSPFEASPIHASVATTPATPPLLVLIDNGDGSAKNMARSLKANGITLFVILAGGEQILSVHGQAGLQRIGSSVTMRTASGASPTNGP